MNKEGRDFDQEDKKRMRGWLLSPVAGKNQDDVIETVLYNDVNRVRFK